MKLINLKSSYLFYIVEDISDASERLHHEMQKYPEWSFAGNARSVKQAIIGISEHKPDLIFCDWDLVGGSGFEVLQQIREIRDYDPFIIFNTGFQSDHPEIAEELINKYKPDAYITKPYWHKLRQQLDELIYKAISKKKKEAPQNNAVWLTDQFGKKCSIDLSGLICILQSVQNSRAKIIYSTFYKQGKEFILTWKECQHMLDEFQIDYFITNKRFSLVVKNYIESYKLPHIYLRGTDISVEVVEDYTRYFEKWIGT